MPPAVELKLSATLYKARRRGLDATCRRAKALGYPFRSPPPRAGSGHAGGLRMRSLPLQGLGGCDMGHMLSLLSTPRSAQDDNRARADKVLLASHPLRAPRIDNIGR